MIRFLHCADLHLDSPFSGLSPEQAAARRALQRQLPARIVEQANAAGCQLLLCSGDVFDSELVCPETLEALRTALEACRCPVFVAPGNHDPYGPSSPWQALSWPSQVHLFTGAPTSVTLDSLGCRVWGGAFTARDCYDALPAAEPCGLTELGVYHGDLHPGPYRYLSRKAIGACGLDYLALGHIHTTALPVRVGRTWVGWPGISMGRGFDETGVHGIFLVDLDGEQCRTALVPMAGPRYETMTVHAGDHWNLPADANNWICRVILAGESEPPDLEALRQRLEPCFYSLDLRDETVPPVDLWAESGRDTLRGHALEQLQVRLDRADEAEARTLTLAARYLLAALEGREAP